jgi:hypothetical protein
VSPAGGTFEILIPDLPDAVSFKLNGPQENVYFSSANKVLANVSLDDLRALAINENRE